MRSTTASEPFFCALGVEKVLKVKNILAFIARLPLIRGVVNSYRTYVEKISTTGYVSAPPNWFWNLFVVLFGIWSLIQVGRVRVVGRKNLRARGRVIYCPNHSSLLDAIVMLPILPKRVRGIGAYETFRQFAGVPGMVMSQLGVIPVDRTKGKTVLEPAIKVMLDGDSIVVFPEGKISSSGELLTFKLGPAYITNAVFEQLGGTEPVWIVPINIHYHSRDTASALDYLKMGFKWRGGCTITALEPIRLELLDNREPGHIMSLVRRAIENVRAS